MRTPAYLHQLSRKWYRLIDYGLINATQSIMPVDKYGIFGPYFLFRKK